MRYINKQTGVILEPRNENVCKQLKNNSSFALYRGAKPEKSEPIPVESVPTFDK